MNGRVIFGDWPLLERAGLRLMRRRRGVLQAISREGPIHLLNDKERHAIRRVERGAVIRATVAGGLTALIAALTEVWVRRTDTQEVVFWDGSARYWIILGSVVGVATVIEMVFLYWDSLRSVHRLGILSGHHLFEEEEAAAVERALVRAALELPNPVKPILGVDPQREISRWRSVLTGFFYKIKVGLSNFMLRALLRRAAGRAALRSWIPFVAIPITGLWNGYISWRVMREARVRAFGPSACLDFVQKRSWDGLSKAGATAVIEGVASAIVRTRDRHPNVVILLILLMERLDIKEEAVCADVNDYLAQLANLPPQEQALALKTLTMAAVLDGWVPKREMGLLKDAFHAAGRSFNPETVKQFKKRFVSGKRCARIGQQAADKNPEQ